MRSSHFLDQTPDHIDIKRLRDHIAVEDLTLGYPICTNSYPAFDLFSLGLIPSPLRDIRLHIVHTNHPKLCIHASICIIYRLFSHLMSDFAYTHLFHTWTQSFSKLKRALLVPNLSVTLRIHLSTIIKFIFVRNVFDHLTSRCELWWELIRIAACDLRQSGRSSIDLVKNI